MNSFSLKRSLTLKRLCSLCCFSCGLMKSFTEESNCLSLVIGPHASLTDSLQQYMNVRISAKVIILHEQEPLVSLISWCLCLLSQASFIDCVCSLCGGPQTSEILKFLSLPRYDTLLISYWSGEQSIMSCSVTSDHVSAGSWSFWCSALTSRPPWSSWRIDWRFLRSWRCPALKVRCCLSNIVTEQSSCSSYNC